MNRKSRAHFSWSHLVLLLVTKPLLPALSRMLCLLGEIPWLLFPSKRLPKPAIVIASAAVTSLPASAMRIRARDIALPAPKIIWTGMLEWVFLNLPPLRSRRTTARAHRLSRFLRAPILRHACVKFPPTRWHTSDLIACGGRLYFAVLVAVGRTGF